MVAGAKTNEDWFSDIPSDWDVVKIRHVAQLESGHTPSKSEPKYWKDCDIPWVTTSDIQKLRNTEKMRLYETENKINELGLANSGAKLLPADTVFLSRTASIGFSGIMGKPMATSQDFANWVCGDSLVPEYLVYCFRSMEQEFERLAEGSTHKTIYMPDIRSLKIPLPPVKVQKEIVEYLDKQIAKIHEALHQEEDLLNTINKKKKSEITHATTGGLSRKQCVKTKSDWYKSIPEDWELQQLKYLTKEYAQIVYGIVQPGPDQDEGVPYIKGGQCTKEALTLDNLSKTTEEIAEKYERAKLERNDLVYEIRGSVGRVVKIPPELEGANLTQDTARISPRDDINPDWLLFALRSEPFYQQMEVEVQGAAVEGVNLVDLRRGVVAVPPQRKQDQIADHLTTLESRLSDLSGKVEENIRQLCKKKQSTIYFGVTGLIQIPEDDEQEPEVPA